MKKQNCPNQISTKSWTTSERTLTRIQKALGNAHDLEELVDSVGRFKRKVGKSKASQLKNHIQKTKTKNLERYRDIVEQTQILSQI